MNTFFISDLHFFHKNIIKYSNRPFSSVEEMNESLIKEWNYIVKPNDVIYNLGDFCFSDIEKLKSILSRLNGNHHFISGNHDKNIVNNSTYLINNSYIKTINTYKEIKIYNQHIVLFHYGCRVWNKSHYGSWLLYGHSHGSLEPFGKSVDVGVDSTYIHNEYRPTAFEEIKDFMKTR